MKITYYLHIINKLNSIKFEEDTYQRIGSGFWIGG